MPKRYAGARYMPGYLMTCVWSAIHKTVTK